MSHDYDIVIIGGGMVGASLARALAGQPLSIAMVEATPLDSAAQPSYDDRVLALSWGARRILETMGVWRHLRDGATPIETIHVSQKGRFGSALLEAAEENVEALGYVAEARVLGAALHRALQGQQNLETFCPARAVAVEPGEEGSRVEIELGDGVRRDLHARLVVAVDGTHSRVRDQFLAIPTTVRDYGQTALIANVTPERPHRNVAYERFTGSGPVAVLPMSLNRCAIVWTHTHEAAAEVLALDDAAFLARLQERFGHRLGRLIKAGERHAYPLALIRAERQIDHRAVVIGNAAHTLHPIAGQGFNLCLRDVALLAELLAEGGDPGVGERLARYEAGRIKDQDRVIGFSDGLLRLFTNPWPPLAHARGAGLAAFDLCPPLKHLFARQNMGTLGRLPRLARGLPL
ncbi:2-octaprenyl-6-methoxyphenyl hydroxylase [Endothiovibrio diazotrophicus]